MDEKEREELIGKMNLVLVTPQTITDKQLLRKELALTRQRGYAICDQELAVGLRALGVPNFKEEREVEAVLSLSFPCHRTEGSNLEAVFVERLLEISSKISVEH